jgi:hypothetical protein
MKSFGGDDKIILYLQQVTAKVPQRIGPANAAAPLKSIIRVTGKMSRHA